MYVTMLRNPAKSYACPLLEGQSGDVEDNLGKLLVKENLAVEVPRSLHAVPSQPAAISHAKTTQVTGAGPLPASFGKLPAAPVAAEVSSTDAVESQSVAEHDTELEEFKTKAGGAKRK